MQEGFGRKLMEMFESWGIADRRWQSIAQAVTSKGVPVQNAEGKDILLGLLVTLNYAKVKFRGGKPENARFYLSLKAKQM